jgi:hypothetical protein
MSADIHAQHIQTKQLIEDKNELERALFAV